MKKKLAIAAALAIVIAGSAFGGWRLVEARKAERQTEERARLAQDFAEVQQCFFGANVSAGEISFKRLRTISGLLSGAGTDWPSGCSARIDGFRTRVETAHFLDRTAADRLSTALYHLDNYLSDSELQLTRLAEMLANAWRLAEVAGISPATPTTEPPPLPRSMPQGQARLPLGGFVELSGGRGWQFLAWSPEDTGIAVCSASNAVLSCKRLRATPAQATKLRGARAVGSSSAPGSLALREGGTLVLVHDGEAQWLDAQVDENAFVHVTDAADVVWLSRGDDRERRAVSLSTRRLGGPSRTQKLGDAVRKLDPKWAEKINDAALLGPRLIVERASGELVRFDLAADGALSNPLPLEAPPKSDDEQQGPGSLWSPPRFTGCRAGPDDLVWVGKQIGFDAGDSLKWHEADFVTCSAAGAVRAQAQRCLPSGCTSSTSMNASDRVGDSTAVAWQGSFEVGLLVRGDVNRIETTTLIDDGSPAPPAPARDPKEFGVIDLLNTGVGGPTQTFGVFGGPAGGVVLFQDKRGPVIGAWVDAAGEVLPLAVSGL